MRIFVAVFALLFFSTSVYAQGVFSSEAGAWTILVTRPDGLSCVAAAGRAWENIKPKIKSNT